MQSGKPIENVVFSNLNYQLQSTIKSEPTSKDGVAVIKDFYSNPFILATKGNDCLFLPSHYTNATNTGYKISVITDR